MKPRIRCLFGAGMIVLLVLGGAGCAKKQPLVEHPIVVQAETIQAGLQSASFTYAGDVRGRYESQFAFQAGGRISERMVSNGEAVKAGQALMRIDLADLKTQLERSRADLAAAEADYRLNELAYNRYKELARQEVISKGEFDNHTAQFQVSTAKLRAAEAALRTGPWAPGALLRCAWPPAWRPAQNPASRSRCAPHSHCQPDATSPP